jgi:hypothetical protein
VTAGDTPANENVPAMYAAVVAQDMIDPAVKGNLDFWPGL